MTRYLLPASFAAALASGAVANGITVDNCGDPLVFDSAPVRFVVHDMNMTDMAFALDLQD
ncbi:MAG: ABC transporter substrate-binding protein, partial [Boseongicola sp. SB0676_bin_33]|nr:ABC transporter substrate-binding protein [Boseongicola sp. SB0676_bin_33]